MRAAVAVILIAAPLTAAQAEAGAGCDLARSMSERESGRRALAARKYSAAAHNFQTAFEACPSQHSILVELSQAYSYQRNVTQAVEAAQRFVELEPASSAGHLALANAYFMAARLPDALRETDRILKSEPGNASALKLKGNIEYLSGRLDNALNTFFQLLERHPEDEEGPYMLGRIYYQEGRIDYAIGQFDRVLRLNPQSYKAYDNLGLCYETRGDTEMAIRYYLSAIKLVEKDHPEYDWAYANLASLLVDKGDPQKAFDAASKAAERNPYSARNFYIGGKALSKLGKNDLAVNWLERSCSLDPAYPEPLYLLARLYAQAGQQEKAKQTMEKFRAAKAAAPRQRK